MKQDDPIICGIYKITNLTNNKSYIGQSINILSRWDHEWQHANNPNHPFYNSELGTDLRELGRENFMFQVMEECDEPQLEERERYWIQQEDTFFNGYNQNFGGNHRNGMEKEKVIGIMKDLKYTNLYQREIAERWGVSVNTVQAINRGRSWHMEGYPYPIQKQHKPYYFYGYGRKR